MLILFLLRSNNWLLLIFVTSTSSILSTIDQKYYCPQQRTAMCPKQIRSRPEPEPLQLAPRQPDSSVLLLFPARKVLWYQDHIHQPVLKSTIVPLVRTDYRLPRFHHTASIDDAFPRPQRWPHRYSLSKSQRTAAFLDQFQLRRQSRERPIFKNGMIVLILPILPKLAKHTARENMYCSKEERVFVA